MTQTNQYTSPTPTTAAVHAIVAASIPAGPRASLFNGERRGRRRREEVGGERRGNEMNRRTRGFGWAQDIIASGGSEHRRFFV